MIQAPKDFRLKFGLSQAELAELLHISRSSLAMIESGRRRFKGKTLESFKLLQQRLSTNQEQLNSAPVVEELESTDYVKKAEKELRIKEHELRNLNYFLNEKMLRHEILINGLTLIREELKIFSALPYYSVRLKKINQKYLKKMACNSSESIDFTKLQIELLQSQITYLSSFIATKKTRIER